ncbi:MAG: hypothetical protein GY847_00840 [Proteobacteria bacterium]|nr:hypothetical protein [Pseudomonadota bacterium]
MSETGGPSALRGYRLQTLYALERILTAPNEDTIFLLEGAEDLDVRSNNDAPSEYIQVKARKDTLAVSRLEEFFRRALNRAQDDSTAIQRLVSYGPIGPEVRSAWAGDEAARKRIVDKLRGKNIKDVDQLFTYVRLEEANETDSTRKVFSIIEGTIAGGEPSHAFEILSYWLHRRSEIQKPVSKPDVLEKIRNVGKYLAARSTYHKEWFTSIEPVIAETGIESDTTVLREQFYQGIGARYEHISAEVDVPRMEKMDAVSNAFNNSRVVVIHGASGQGKSALAYRYLHDHVPSQLRFEVRSIQDLRHAQSISCALIDHATAMDTPLTVYLDVQPRDTSWIEIVNKLGRFRNIYLLITVREEDWSRATTLEWPEFREVELSFDENEARRIYKQLIAREVPVQLLDFEDAWQRFQPVGPLLEFVYFVTQNMRLRKRLEQQVKTLQEELEPKEISFLHAVAAASAYGARLELGKLVKFLELSKPQVTLARFEREYLIRTSHEGQYVEGLHPIRSQFLEDLLSDPILAPWITAAELSLNSIVESDLEIFLLYAFLYRQKSTEGILDTLHRCRPHTWTGFGGALRALLWLGIREHVALHRSLIDHAIEKFGDGWALFPLWDIINLESLNPELKNSGFEKLNFVPGELKIAVEDIRRRRTPEHATFDSARNWLLTQEESLHEPIEGADWLGVAETYFWFGFWRLPHQGRLWLRQIDPLDAISLQPIDIACDVLYGFSFLDDGTIQGRLDEVRPLAIEEFAKRHNVVIIEDDGKRASAHFLLGAEELLSDGAESPEDQVSDAGNSDLSPRFHDLVMTYVRSLHKIFPNRERIGCQGYGHMLDILQIDYDATTMNVDTRYLYPEWAVQHNGVFRGLVDHSRRPTDWPAYCEKIMQIREMNLDCMRQLRQGIRRYFKTRTYYNLFNHSINLQAWDAAKKLISQYPLLPRIAFDKWGLSGDEQRKLREKIKIDKESLAYHKYRRYTEFSQNFLTAIGNFYGQAISVIWAHPKIWRARKTEREREILEEQLGEANGYNQHIIHLSIYNFGEAIRHLEGYQEEFRKMFAQFFEQDQLAQIDERERKELAMSWALWYAFARHPERLVRDAAKQLPRRLNSMVEKRLLTLRVDLRELCSETAVQIKIRDDVKWESERALWLLCDLADPLVKFDVLKNIFDILDICLRPCGDKQMEYALRFHRPHIMIVFLIKGKMLRAEMLHLRPFLFDGDDQSLIEKSEKSPALFVPNAIPHEIARSLDLEIWNNSRIVSMRRYREGFETLVNALSWFQNFLKLPDGVYENQEIIQRVQHDGGRRLREFFKNFFEATNAIRDTIEDIDESEFTERSVLVEIYEQLEEIVQEIIAFADTDGIINTLAIDQIREMATKLSDRRIDTEVIEILWTSDVLQHDLL